MTSQPTMTRLVLPSESPAEWAAIEAALAKPINSLAELDQLLTDFAKALDEPKVCNFFSSVPGSLEAGSFDFDAFLDHGVPALVAIALEMPVLFDEVVVPIHRMRSSWADAAAGRLGRLRVTLSRRQCACLLAHSFLGTLRRPADVQKNDFRLRVGDLFMGTSMSPNSAVTFLSYFTVIGERGLPDDEHVTFERRGFCRGQTPWRWDDNPKRLCPVKLIDGRIEESPADTHVEFSNAFIGGGVMTGDAAMEELLFLAKPELMIAMALQHRMVDEESICITGARQYSLTDGYGQSFEFTRACTHEELNRSPPAVCALDAVRGGGPAVTVPAMLRDMNKARIAFDGANELATGHWGCGAFGNNQDLMFLKQWLAASDAGVTTMLYHEYGRGHSHSIFPLVRKLKHLTVGHLWNFLQSLTSDLAPMDVASFSERIRAVSLGRIPVPPE